MSRTLTIGLGFFLVFFAYFSFTAYHLPDAAGPDFKFSRVAADFYYDENRMAIVPQDEDKMVFSRYGNSRLLRPPLGFYLPAQMAKLPILKDVERYYAYRVTSAMLAGLTIMFIFFALKMYFNSLRYAVFGTLSIGLLPQFGFYASYFSDDMIAFFSSSVLAYAMVSIYKQGVSLSRQLLFAFAAGLSVVSKPTAWVLLGPAIAFYFIYMLEYSKEYFKSREFYVPLILMSAVFIIGGGWWLIFNMYQYGISEIFLSKTVAEVTSRNARIDLDALGYGSQGIDMAHLLAMNFNNFLGATYIAFVGNLDWLRIKLGSLQYGFYMWMLAGITLNAMVLAYQTVDYCWKRFDGLIYDSYPRTFIFEVLLYAAIVLQLLVYTHHNVYSDIQIQGKYLMTMFIPMVILALSFFSKALTYLADRFSHVDTHQAVKLSALVLIMLLPFVMHIDALVDYVIPFYWPQLELPAILRWI